jgi:hypothetical protein
VRATAFGARAGRAGARMVGERMAENVAMGRPNLPSMFAEPRSSLFAVEPSPMIPKPQAPVSELGFYSATEQAALNLPRNKGTGQAFLNDLMKAPDVKKDELAWTGLDDFLKDKPNVTKQEVQDFIANNKVDLQEVQLSGDPNKTRPFVEWSPSDKTYLVYGDDEVPIATFNTAIDAQKFVDQNYGKPTQYSNYQLAGGENYREILLKIPNQWDKPRAAQIANEERIKALRQEMYGTSGTNEIRSEISRLQNENTALQKQISEAPIYKSSHFDEPNILAHIRVNDRVDADGKKMLLVEEIQSDWHQAGREKGYQNKSGQYGEKVTPEEYKRGVELQNQQRNQSEPLTPLEQTELSDIMTRHEASIVGARVPDAPFKDNWYQLALKRVMKYAADNGYERVGLTTGEQQAKRYDLSKQVDYIDYKTSGYGDSAKYSLGIVDKNQQGIDLPKEYYSAKELPEIVGKEIAEKIIKGEGQSGGGRMTLRGVDLQVGGEGMKKYYDEIYPKFLEKYGKKWDAGVGDTKISTEASPKSWAYFRDWFSKNHSDAGGSSTALANWEQGENSKYVREFLKQNKVQEPIRYIDITPKMKESVGKGQPLFTAIPAGTLGLGGLEYADPFASPLTEDTTR